LHLSHFCNSQTLNLTMPYRHLAQQLTLLRIVIN
jgi:hypothetical protein